MEENKPEPPPSPTRVGRGKICRHWYKGHCWLDTTCGFLHPPRETMPPNLVFEYKSKQQEKSINNADGEPVHKKEHTGGRVCHHWERGYCWLGNTCGFLHTELPRTNVQYPGYGQGGYTGMGGKMNGMGEVPQLMHHYNQHQQQPYRNGVRIASPPRQPNYHVRPPNLMPQNVNAYHVGNPHSPHTHNSPHLMPQQPPNTNSQVLQQEAYPPLTGGYYSS